MRTKVGGARRRRGLIFFWGRLFMAGVCGGMKANSFDMQEKMNSDKAAYLAYLSDKYGTEFLPISLASGDLLTDYDEFRAYASGSDPDRDYTTVYKTVKDGVVSYEDNYFGILIRDEYERRVADICRTEFNKAAVFIDSYTVSVFDPSLGKDSTLDDAIALGERLNAFKYVYGELPGGDTAGFDAAADRICAKLKEAKLPGIVKICGLAPGGIDSVSAENYADFLPDYFTADGVTALAIATRTVNLR
jgi:hypothetical protein